MDYQEAQGRALSRSKLETPRTYTRVRRCRTSALWELLFTLGSPIAAKTQKSGSLVLEGVLPEFLSGDFFFHPGPSLFLEAHIVWFCVSRWDPL